MSHLLARDLFLLLCVEEMESAWLRVATVDKECVFGFGLWRCYCSAEAYAYARAFCISGIESR